MRRSIMIGKNNQKVASRASPVGQGGRWLEKCRRPNCSNDIQEQILFMNQIRMSRVHRWKRLDKYISSFHANTQTMD